VQLFTFATSPYARKVRMALDIKGIGYEPIERCYSLDRKKDLFAASPRAEVPALILDDGRTIADSTIICEYLDDAFPEPASVLPIHMSGRGCAKSKSCATEHSIPSVTAIGSRRRAKALPKLRR